MHSVFILAPPTGNCQENCNILFTETLPPGEPGALTRGRTGAIINTLKIETRRKGSHFPKRSGTESSRRWLEAAVRSGIRPPPLSGAPNAGRRLLPWLFTQGTTAGTVTGRNEEAPPSGRALNPGGTAGPWQNLLYHKAAGRLPQSACWGRRFSLPRRKGVSHGKDRSERPSKGI